MHNHCAMCCMVLFIFHGKEQDLFCSFFWTSLEFLQFDHWYSIIQCWLMLSEQLPLVPRAGSCLAHNFTSCRPETSDERGHPSPRLSYRPEDLRVWLCCRQKPWASAGPCYASLSDEWVTSQSCQTQKRRCQIISHQIMMFTLQRAQQMETCGHVAPGN